MNGVKEIHDISFSEMRLIQALQAESKMTLPFYMVSKESRKYL